MSDTLASLRRKVDGADTLKSVVRTMKAIAASSIGQYEAAILALTDYERTVALGLTACLRQAGPFTAPPPTVSTEPVTNIIAFGSDQGLVGQFNEVLAELVVRTLPALPGKKQIRVIGERLFGCLAQADQPLAQLYAVPNSVMAITPLIGQLQIDVEAQNHYGKYAYSRAHVHVFHNCPEPGGQYRPITQQLLPLNSEWQNRIASTAWPTNCLPEVIGNHGQTLSTLIREYLFIFLFKACAESLTSENAGRLAAMQRAEKNIAALSDQLHQSFYRLRQSSIDEELFDVIAGFNSQSN